MKRALWLMPVTILIALILAFPISANAAAKFEVSDLNISPIFAKVTENVNISVKVTNVGDEAGTYAAELKINNTVETAKTIDLEPGDDEKIIFNVSKETAGEYTVKIGKLEGSFTVAPKDLELKGLLIDPLEVSQGEKVVISITAQNKSTEQTLSFDALKLKINGEVIASKDINLKKGESTTLSFTVTREEVGDYVVQIGPKKGSFTVKASFWSTFPPYLWAIFGAIAGIVIMLVIVLVFTSPLKRKAIAGPKAGKPAKAPPPPTPVQPMPPQRTSPQPMQPRVAPPQPLPSQPAPSQPVPPQPAPAQPMPPQPKPDQQTGPRQLPPQPTPIQPTTPRAMPPQPAPARPIPAQSPITPKPEQPAATPPFTPTPQPVPTPAPTPTPTPFIAPVKTAPLFSVSNLTITPNQVKDGDPVTISAIVTNRGTVVGQYSMVLRIGSVVESVSELTVNPGGTQMATFTVVKDIAGDYYVEVDGLRGMFTVITRLPAAFSISNLTIIPEKVKQGENVAISAVATNTGEIAGNYSVVLRVKGIAESIEEISLGPGRNQKVTFNITKDAAGFYPVSVENLTGRFVVEMDWTG